MTLQISDEQVQEALDVLLDESAAEARAAHEWMQETTKVVLARLCSQSNEKAQNQRENWAMQHPDYVAHLAMKRQTARADYAARQRIAAANARLDAWRTLSANYRGQDKVR